MTTHQYLNQIYRLNKRLEVLTLYAEKLRGETERVTAPPFDKIRTQSSGHRDNSVIIVKLAECEAELLAVRLEMISQRDHIMKQIQELACGSEGDANFTNYIEVLTRRYILFEKFSDIAQAMHYTEKHIFRLKKAALTAFENKYGEEYADS